MHQKQLYNIYKVAPTFSDINSTFYMVWLPMGGCMFIPH